MCEYKEVCNAPSEAAMEGMLKTHFMYKPWDHEKVDQKEMKE
jgi:hypothetical protein